MAGLVVMCAAFVVAGIDGGSVMVMSDSVSPSFGSDQQSWATDCVFSANRTRILQFSLLQKSVGPEQGEQILIFHLRKVGKLQVDGK